ncbi:Ribosome-binding protein 1, partial [Stegodyphus mimosarum]
MSVESTVQNLHDWLQKTMAWFSSSTSAMDLHTAVICAGVFVISALVVYLISVFGMRERTYEEAIEEQRRRNQEAIQQAKTDKNKKDKKFKKWGKRPKEKSEEERNTNCEVESKSNTKENEVKGMDPEVNCSPANQISDMKSSAKKKVRQRKQTVADKEEECSQQLSSSEETDESPSPSNSIDNVVPVEDERKPLVDKSSGIKEDLKSLTAESSVEHQDNFREKSEEVDTVKSTKKSPQKKNKKSKLDNAESNSEYSEWNGVRIVNAIKSITLTEEEIQHIHDLLNSKQKGGDKKKSEIGALKKIIQDKEDLLRAEQKLSQAANEKISDLLQELSEEKARASASEKSLRDALNQEQQEIKALHGMMQRKREQYASEISSLQSKMQQMKNKLKEEHALAIQRLQEENNQLQSLNRLESEKQQRSTLEISRLQHEVEQLRSSREKFETHQAAMQQNQEDLHHQIQQLEKHIEQLMSSHQEEEYSYKQRMNEISNKLQQTENARSSLVQELQNAQSVCSSLEADNSSLRQHLDEAKHQINSTEQDIIQLQSRLEEANRQQRDLTNCLEKMRGEVMDLSNVKHEQLQVIQSLKQENEALAAQITQNMDKIVGEGSEENQQNGEISEKSSCIEIEEHEAIVQEKENMLHRLFQELDQCKCEIMSLSNDLERESKRNEELVNKNGELVEALDVTEKKLQDVIKTAELKVQEAQMKADNCSNEIQDILNERIKEVEHALRESYAKELESVREEAEKAKKESDERILIAESKANLRLEEFQESLYERLNVLNLESEAKIKEALEEKEQIKSDLENFHLSLKNFLHNVFPDLQVIERLDNKALSQYEREAKCYIDKIRQDQGGYGSKDAENVIRKLENATQEKLNLQSQIKKYESVLAETESILKTLQNNIEIEEKKWKKEIQSKDESLKEVLSENEKLKLQNKTLLTNLEQLQGLKEALCEIEDLRQRLQKEELEKKSLQEKLGVLDSLTNNSSISVSENNLMQIPEGASGRK